MPAGTVTTGVGDNSRVWPSDVEQDEVMPLAMSTMHAQLKANPCTKRISADSESADDFLEHDTLTCGEK